MQRVLTALVLAPLVILGIFQLSAPMFAIALAGVMLIGAWELLRICGVENLLAKSGYLLVLALGMWLLYTAGGLPFQALLYFSAAAWWILFLFLVLGGKLNRHPDQMRIGTTLVGGGVLLVASWSAMAAIQGSLGAWMLLFLFIVIWVADSGAYFAGRAFGRHKLAPVVSPGKTWEGLYGALLGAIVCGVVVATTGWLGEFQLLPLVVLCVATALISIGGDLWESLLKRHGGVKDSGNILPGHGGILDRIDSLIAAAPFFIAGLSLMGRFP